jgi:anti-anti-sigma factor
MKISTTYDNGAFYAVLTESFTFSDHATFRELLREMESKTLSQITIDLAAVDFVDSAALGMLLLLREVSTKKRAVVTISGSQGQVRKMLEISKFGQLFKLV